MSPANRHTASGVLRELLDAQVSGVQAADGGLGTSGWSGIHRMRVELRRLRSTLKAFQPFFDDSVDGLRNELRWFSYELGPARDAEVLAARLTAACADDERLGPKARAFLDPLLSSMQEDAVARAQEAWGSERYADLSTSLGQLFASRLITLDRGTAAAEVFPPLMARQLALLRKRAELVGGAGDRDEQVHELRKATKQARYVGEVLHPLNPKPAAKLGRALQRLQDLLGSRQDSAVARLYLHRLLEEGHLDKRAASVVARLLNHEIAATDALDERLPKALKKVACRAEWLPVT